MNVSPTAEMAMIEPVTSPLTSNWTNSDIARNRTPKPAWHPIRSPWRLGYLFRLLGHSTDAGAMPMMGRSGTEREEATGEQRCRFDRGSRLWPRLTNLIDWNWAGSFLS